MSDKVRGPFKITLHRETDLDLEIYSIGGKDRLQSLNSWTSRYSLEGD